MLLVVDFAQAYVAADSQLYAAAENALASTIRLIDAARSAGVPVGFTKVIYEDGAAQAGVFWQKSGRALEAFNHDNPHSALADGLAPEADDLVITKHYASAFFGTDLAEQLADMTIDTVIIAGTSTSGCVRATAVDACQYGFAPMVVREAVADRHPTPHESALFDLDAKYADVVSEADVLAYFANR